MNKRLTLRLPLVLSLLASACTVVEGSGEEPITEEGEVVLANPDDEGKGDTVFGKTLRYNLRGEWQWTEGDDSMVTDTEVVTQTSNMVRVRALRVAIGLPADELLEVSVDAEAFNDFGEISTDMAFLLFASDRDRAWHPSQCAQNYFERVVIDPMSRQIDAVTRGANGDSVRSFSFAECGIPEGISQVAIFPFPSSGWWSLEGYYHLKIEADCGTAVCPAGRAIRYF